MKTLTAGNVPKMESSKSPKLMPVNCSRLRLYELVRDGSTCSAGAMKGLLVIAGEGGSITVVLASTGKLTPRSMLPEGFSPRTALQEVLVSEVASISSGQDLGVLSQRYIRLTCSQNHSGRGRELTKQAIEGRYDCRKLMQMRITLQ